MHYFGNIRSFQTKYYASSVGKNSTISVTFGPLGCLVSAAVLKLQCQKSNNNRHNRIIFKKKKDARHLLCKFHTIIKNTLNVTKTTTARLKGQRYVTFQSAGACVFFYYWSMSIDIDSVIDASFTEEKISNKCKARKTITYRKLKMINIVSNVQFEENLNINCFCIQKKFRGSQSCACLFRKGLLHF